MKKRASALLFFVLGSLATYGWFLSARVSTFWKFATDNGQVSAVFVTALLAAAIAIWGIQSQRSIARRQKTLELILDQESDEDIINARRAFVAVATDPKLKIEDFASPEKRNTIEGDAIRRTLNSYELMSIGIQKGVIDYDLYRIWMKAGTIKYWGYSESYIISIRKKSGNPLLYHEFETMISWLTKDTRPKRRGYFLGQWF
jgi:hypothetical protein